MTREMSRVTKGNAKPVIIYFPDEVLPVIAAAVCELDTDRSKFIRLAVREKLSRVNRVLEK